MWRNKNHQEKQGDKETLAQGFNSSNINWQCQNYLHSKRGSATYPDFSKQFDIYTDASTKQVGAIITQDNRPNVFFGWKLSGVQSKYTVTKLVIVATMETLKEFNKMLWGQWINVYTNHKNLTQEGLGLISDE